MLTWCDCVVVGLKTIRVLEEFHNGWLRRQMPVSETQHHTNTTLMAIGIKIRSIFMRMSCIAFNTRVTAVAISGKSPRTSARSVKDESLLENWPRPSSRG